MRKITTAVLVTALFLTLATGIAQANPADDCPRIGAYVERVAALVERATPLIQESGNARAIALLESAIVDIRAAHRAYNDENCRLAFNLGQQADQKIHMALRMIHRPASD